MIGLFAYKWKKITEKVYCIQKCLRGNYVKWTLCSIGNNRGKKALAVPKCPDLEETLEEKKKKNLQHLAIL